MDCYTAALRKSVWIDGSGSWVWGSNSGLYWGRMRMNVLIPRLALVASWL